MSTAQDHKALASLQDVFGPGAGSSGYNFNSGVATFSSTGAAGPGGSEGLQGRAGNTLGNVNAIAQPAMGMVIQKSIKDMAHTLANAETLEEFDSAIKRAKRVSNAAATAEKVGNVASVSQGLTALGDVTSGQVPPIERIFTDVVKGTTPLGPISAVTGAVLKGYDPIAPIVQAAEKGMRYVPGVGWVNDKLSKVGQKIKEVVPSEVSAALKNLGNFPNEILDIGGKFYRSFRDADEIEASDRDEALTKMFTEEVNGELYISQPTEENRDEVVNGIDLPTEGWGQGPQAHLRQWLPGNVNADGLGKYNSRYNFPYGEGKTRQELFEEFLESESGQTLAEEYQYKPAPPDAEVVSTDPTSPLYESSESPAIKDEDYPLPDISNSLGSPASTAGLPLIERQAVAMAGLDQYPPVPDQPQTHDPTLPHYKETPPLNYYTFPLGVKPPIIEPQRYESPTADPYQAPKAPTPVEIAPRVLPVERPPLSRVRPEEVITPRIMTPRRIRPQKDMTKYEPFASPAWQALGTASTSTNYSKPHIADLLGFNAPPRTASQYMDLDARTKPKHNLRELTTGRNASSYRG